MARWWVFVVFATIACTEAILVRFNVQIDKSKSGSFVIEAHPEWAPIGVQRFQEMITQSILNEARFFRVISGFMAQFGIPGDPSVAAAWRSRTIRDDPVAQSNKRGYITFATSGPNSRTTQLFINFADNDNLDSMGFAPIGRVTEGMDVVDALYSGYGEGAPSGNGPDQGRIQRQGNSYLEQYFPNLSYIISTEVLGDADQGETASPETLNPRRRLTQQIMPPPPRQHRAHKISFSPDDE
eukprot:c25268_g1_i1.p1 GENE.c25268_g1_i1~~c25268_g1_i1.p1  ORF type:complete len:240 (-),score=48.92 c25268_g1_i1:54-773(-)